MKKVENAINRYKAFCKSKKLEPTDDDIKLELDIEETYYFLYPDEALNHQLKVAYDEYDAVYKSLNCSGEKLYAAQKGAVETIDQITDLINSISKFPKEFESSISEISINREEFRTNDDFAIEEQKGPHHSTIATGTGIVAGTTVATMAPSAAMWIATTFGTASTGTAISTLTGAAASKAALAWLGGGAVAAGGGGMAAGQALLALAGPVGWGIAGATVVSSTLLFFCKKNKLTKEKKKEIDRIIFYTNELKKLSANLNTRTTQIQQMNTKLSSQFKSLSSFYGADFSTFSAEQMDALGALVNNTNSLSVLIRTVICDNEE